MKLVLATCHLQEVWEQLVQRGGIHNQPMKLMHKFSISILLKDRYHKMLQDICCKHRHKHPGFHPPQKQQLKSNALQTSYSPPTPNPRKQHLWDWWKQISHTIKLQWIKTCFAMDYIGSRKEAPEWPTHIILTKKHKSNYPFHGTGSN